MRNAALLTVTLLGLTACADLEEEDATSLEVRGGVVVGLHDGAINHCDNFESWYRQNVLVFGMPGYPNYAATAQEMGDDAWWSPLRVNTVRVSVPWNIALPWSSDRGLVTAHDPPGAWRDYHLAALQNEQTCFDWWLHAAANAHQTVNIAFKPDYDYRDPTTNHILVPDIATYRTAIKNFVAQYATCEYGSIGERCVPLSHAAGGPGPSDVVKVHIITPWGEPDYGNGHYPKNSTDTAKTCTQGCQGNALPSAGITRAKEVFFLPGGSSGMDPQRARFDDPSCTQLTSNACGPVLAAQMWMAVVAACPTCVLTSGPAANAPNSGVVAGDFSGGAGLTVGTVPGGQQSYLKTYSQHLNHCAGCAGARPRTWGLHPYPDTSNEEWCLRQTGRDYDPLADGGSHSTSVRFLDALYRLGYHEKTYVWLDEISVFATDNYHHDSTNSPKATGGVSCGRNTSGQKPSYSPAIQAKAFRWLARTLPAIKGTLAPGRQPVIDRIYYFRSFAGTVPNGDNITPINPTPNQQALYDAIVNR